MRDRITLFSNIIKFVQALISDKMAMMSTAKKEANDLMLKIVKADSFYKLARLSDMRRDLQRRTSTMSSLDAMDLATITGMVQAIKYAESLEKQTMADTISLELNTSGALLEMSDEKAKEFSDKIREFIDSI